MSYSDNRCTTGEPPARSRACGTSICACQARFRLTCLQDPASMQRCLDALRGGQLAPPVAALQGWLSESMWMIPFLSLEIA